MAGLNDTVCWFPDGVSQPTGNPIHVPCDPTAPNSACCPLGASCVGHGLCYSNHGAILRGSCTDSQWLAPECATVCKDKTGFMEGSQDSYTWLTRCQFNEASDEFTWECGLNAVCSDNAWPLAIGGIEQVNISGLAADPVLKWNGKSTSFAAVPTSTQSGPKNQASTDAAKHCAALAHSTDSVSPVVVGASVGAPLALLALVALASTFWYRRKWIQAQKGTPVTHGPMAETMEGVETPSGIQPKWELHAKRAYHAQLDGNQSAVHEMGSPTYR